MSRIEAAPIANQEITVRKSSLTSNDQNDLQRVLDEPATLHKKASEPMLNEGGQQIERKNDSMKFLHNRRIYSVSQKTHNEQSDSNGQQQGHMLPEINPKVVSETLAELKVTRQLNVPPLKTSHESFHSFASYEEEGEEEGEEHSPEIQMKLAKHSSKEFIVEKEKRTTSKSIKQITGSPSRFRASRQHKPLSIQQQAAQTDKVNQSSEINLEFPLKSQIPENNIEPIAKSKKTRQKFQGKKKKQRLCKQGTLLIESAEEDKEDFEIDLKESVHKDIGQNQVNLEFLSPKNLRTSRSSEFSDCQDQETLQYRSNAASGNNPSTQKNAITNNASSFYQEGSNILENGQITKNSNVNLLPCDKHNRNNGNLQEIVSAFDNEKTQTTEQEEEEDGQHEQIQILEHENDQEQLEINQKEEIVDAQKNQPKQIDSNEQNTDIYDQQQQLSQRKGQGLTETAIKEEGELILNSQQLISKDYSFQSPRVKNRTKSNPTRGDTMQSVYSNEDMQMIGQQEKAKTSQNILTSNLNKNDHSRQEEINKCEEQIVNLTLEMEGNLKQNIEQINKGAGTQQPKANIIQSDNPTTNNDGSQQTIEPLSVQKNYNQGGMRLGGKKSSSNENSINSAETIKLHSATKNFGDSNKNTKQDNEEMPEVIEYTEKREPQESQSTVGVVRLNFQYFSDFEIEGNLNRSEHKTQGGYLIEEEDQKIRDHHIEVLFNTDQKNKASIAADIEEKGREHERSSVSKLHIEGAEEKRLDTHIPQNNQEDLPKNTLTSPQNNSFEFSKYWGELRQQFDQQYREQSCFECLRLMWPQKITSSQQKEKYLILALSEENYNESKPQNVCLLEQVRLLYRKFTLLNKKMTLIMHPDEARKRIERRETCGGTLFSKDTNMQVSDMNIFALVQMFIFLSCEQSYKFAAGSRRLLRKVNLLFLLLRISNLIATKIKENILDACLQQNTDEFIVLTKELFKAIYSEAVVSLLEVTLEPNETNVKLYDNVDKIAKKLTSAQNVIQFLKDSIENQRFFGKTRNSNQNNAHIQPRSFNNIPIPTLQFH